MRLCRPPMDWTASSPGPRRRLLSLKRTHSRRYSVRRENQPSEILRVRRSALSDSPVSFMRSIPRFVRRPNTYSSGRKPFHGLRRLRTTVIRHFVATKKLSKKSRWRTPSDCRVHEEGEKTNCPRAQRPTGKGNRGCDRHRPAVQNNGRALAAPRSGPRGFQGRATFRAAPHGGLPRIFVAATSHVGLSTHNSSRHVSLDRGGGPQVFSHLATATSLPLPRCTQLRIERIE